MQISNSSCAVAVPRERNNATNLNNTTGDATESAAGTRKPASLQELRMKLRAQLECNYSAPARNKTKASELLRNLVLEVMVLVNEPKEDWQYHVDFALSDPIDAMTCYASLKRELQQPIKEI